MAIPRVLVRGSACPSTVSVFDTVIHGAAASYNCHYDRAMISLIEPTRGVISIDNCASLSGPSGRVLCMGRARSYPAFDSTPCPTTLVDRSTTSQQQHGHPFVRLAVVGLVLDAAGSLLVTRRPSYMRSFPSAWVLPGGTLDPNESLLEAIQREVWEETGIESEEDSWKMESLWESVYPTTLSEDDVDEDGLFPATAIKAHHVVVYLSTILSEEKPSLELCKEEVDAAVWLSRDNCRMVVNRDFASAESSMLSFHSSTATLKGDVVPLRHLMGIYPQALSDGNRGGMAQGSLFALEEFLCSL